MHIERSAAIKIQLKEAVELRSKLIATLNELLNSNEVSSEHAKVSDKNQFLYNLELSAEGFVPILDQVSINEVDRACSMIAGPFFVTEEYPIPSTNEGEMLPFDSSSAGGMMLPLLQLNLQEISALSEKDFGDGLLQLWIDPNTSDQSPINLVRVIPRSEINLGKLLSFDYEPHQDVYNSNIPLDFLYEVGDQEVKIITGYRSTGMQCQSEYIDLYAEYIPEEIMKIITDDVQRFKSLLSGCNEFHVLGSFHPIQYSAVDVGMSCLVEFPIWGPSGKSQILYAHGSDWMNFDFMESS